MSTTTMSSANSLAVKLWEKKTWVQAMQRSVLGHAFNRGIAYFPEKLMKTDVRGDAVTFPYVGKLVGMPIGEGGTADGKEEALDLQSHNMVVNTSRIPILNPNEDTVEQKRTNVDFEKRGLEVLGNRAVELMDSSLLQQLAGANPTSLTLNGTTYATVADKLHIQGHNTPVAPTANRILRPNAQTTDQALTSSDTMSLGLIDFALELNERSDQPIAPLADDTFDLFISPEQLVDLQQNTTGAIQWFNIELAKITGGKSNYVEQRFENNLICAGRYRNVNIFALPRVAFGQNSGTSAVITTVRRAVLVGKDAVSFASPFGGRVTDTSVPMKIFTQLKDYEYYKGMECRLIYGLKKMTPSAKDDIGVMVISTFAAAHT